MATASSLPSLMLAAIANHNFLLCRTWTLPYAILPSGSTLLRQISQAPSTRSHFRVTQWNIAEWLHPSGECESTRGLLWAWKVLKRQWMNLCAALSVTFWKRASLPKSQMTFIVEGTACTNSFRTGGECYRHYTSATSAFLHRRPSSIHIPQRYLDGSRL